MGRRPVNAVEAVAIIVAVFFIAGLVVGFLIVMALPALAGHRGREHSARDRLGAGRGDGRRPLGQAGESGDPDDPLTAPWQRNTR